ncbi:nuclear transport factor 2 family protein [Demequina soli]|uniref:nuclear transport factor 2 family protein n=1 Tax=Demequina soli TaxID=1638987 RepID=UPI00078535EA|nr:nuclear transport factor 2 family protein [Demequina soli]
MHEVERLERAGWEARSGGDPRAFFERVLAPDAVMVLPDVGVLERDEAIVEVATAQPWSVHRLEEMRLVTPAENVAILLYLSRAIRWDVEHVARTASTYVLDGHSWRMVLHQETHVSHPS